MPTSNSELDDIAFRLKLIRQALDLSQVALCIRVGNHLSPQKWNNYERGRDRIPVETAIRLCVVSGATLDYIYRGEMGALPGALAARIQQQLIKQAKNVRWA